MIVVMESSASDSSVEAVISYLVQSGCDVHRSSGQTLTILGVVGKVSDSEQAVLEELPGVARVVRVSEPYKLASRRFRSHATIIEGAWGTIGGARPWIAIEPVGLGLRSAHKESEPPASALSYEVVSGRPFDAAVTRTQQAIESIGSLACLSLHERPTEVRWPVLFVTRKPHQGPEQWIVSAERELERADANIVLVEAGGQHPGAERTLEVTALARVQRLTHLPIVVDVPRIAQRSRDCAAIASAAVAAGASGVILRVWVGREGIMPRAAATLSWDSAVALVARLRAIGEVLAQ